MYRPRPKKILESSTPPADIIEPRSSIGSSGTSSSRGSSSNRPSAGSAQILTAQILWRKATNKKHKTWDGDGTAKYKNGVLSASFESKVLRFELSETQIREGKVLSKNGFDIELTDISKETEKENTPKSVELAANSNQKPVRPSKPVVPQPLHALQPVQSVHSPAAPFIPVVRGEPAVATKKTFEKKSIGTATEPEITPPKREPEVKLEDEPAPKKKLLPTTDTPIDPLLLDVLRPHQVAGVTFMYDCVMGKRHNHGYGALLADEMGLGKTLMAITVVWTLLKQKEIKNVLIVVPVSLMGNWKNEFKKWLGELRIGVLVANPGTDVGVFSQIGQRAYQVLIAGYERVRDISSKFADTMGHFDLVICDEGHRLKSRDSQTVQAIEAISGEKRIVLTGTPIQNNLSEFYSLAEYLNPGIFQSQSKFNRRFTDPIAVSREPEATEFEQELGNERNEELVEIIDQFVLRRDLSVLAKYLDVPRTEYVVFCKPSATQAELYRSILSSEMLNIDLKGSSFAFEVIGSLKKVANSTYLSQDKGPEILKSSGKLAVLANIMKKIREADEKVVIACGSTKMLDLIQQLCTNMTMSWVRLDGQTPQNKRQSSVDLFNKSSSKRVFAFLLSSRSGGTGLNLIGASNMVLVDCDWNPAVDLQAMARIHRDGQKKPTFIYRLISTGMIDEKIFQRQLNKNGLATSILDLEASSDTFSQEELKDLLSFSSHPVCDTIEKDLNVYRQLEVDTIPVLSDSKVLIDTVLERTRENSPAIEESH